jgi:hypothetical protein
MSAHDWKARACPRGRAPGGFEIRVMCRLFLLLQHVSRSPAFSVGEMAAARTSSAKMR